VSRWVRFVLAAVGGGTFIAVGDHLFHVRTHVLTHFWHPRWDGQTLLVYPLFIGAAALMIAAATPLVRGCARPAAVRLAVEAGAFYLAYWFTGQVGVRYPGWCVVVLLATFVGRLLLDDNPRAVLLVGIMIGIGGCLGEAAVSEMGLFRYVGRWLVPFWLLPLYLHGAPAVVGLTRVVDLAGVDDAVVPADAAQAVPA